MREMRRESPYPLVALDVAQQLIMARVAPLGVELVATLAADGRVLAATLNAPAPIPEVAKAAMDGYALRTDDRLAERRVVAALRPGSAPGLPLEPGTAVRIMTGAPMPAGADAMLPVEQTTEQDGVLRIVRQLQPGEYVHPIGQDVAQDAVVLTQGHSLGAPEIGILATLGLAQTLVYRRPRVAVLATGDEVCEPGTPRPFGAVYDANRYALLAAVREAGCTVVDLGIARDTYAEQRAAMLQGLAQADVLITSGGVSMGTHDLIKPLLAELGTIHFGRIACKPGQPTTFATIGDQLAFGLPGYPVSSLVAFELCVRPALRALQGDTHPWRPQVRVTLTMPLRPSSDRPEYQRVSIRHEDGRLLAYTTGNQGSSRLLSLVGANGLLHVPPAATPYPTGHSLAALLLGPIFS